MAERGLLIWSGGLDSTTLLFHLRNQGMDITTVHFSYGSKHNDREAMAVASMAQKYDIPVILIPLDWMQRVFKSALLRNGDSIPEGHYADENMKKTVVPFRNGILLSIATGVAESLDIQNVYFGAHAGDHTIYPDCRPRFIQQMGAAMRHGTWKNINLFAPFQDMTKGKIVTRGELVNTPFQMTYTCYKGENCHCGRCGACVERREAFQEANVKDPTRYQHPQEIFPKPRTQNIDVGGIPGEEDFGNV